jgi:Holliday junction resolvasome RuvABC ATP-dependent DNA helicase subunit
MIGQNKLQRFIRNIAVADEIPTEINLMLTGKAGLGKTHSIKWIANTLSKKPELEDCIEHHPRVVTIELAERYADVPLHVIDEVHQLEAFEPFYRFMESHLLLVATNIPEDLPEAFRTRCINLVLENYTKEELGQIVRERYGFDYETTLNLVDRSRGTPRDILQMSSIININPATDLESLGYFKDGFRSEDYLYIDYMKAVGSSSLGRIAAGTNLDSTLIQEYIEPFLLEKGIISITNRRHLNEGRI